MSSISFKHSSHILMSGGITADPDILSLLSFIVKSSYFVSGVTSPFISTSILFISERTGLYSCSSSTNNLMSS